MEPASTIIRRLGGVKVVAQALGTALTAPYRWQKPRAEGGTDGIIPPRHYDALFLLAKKKGVTLFGADLLPPRLRVKRRRRTPVVPAADAAA